MHADFNADVNCSCRGHRGVVHDSLMKANSSNNHNIAHNLSSDVISLRYHLNLHNKINIESDFKAAQ